jgi:hypothetical protein
MVTTYNTNQQNTVQTAPNNYTISTSNIGINGTWSSTSNDPIMTVKQDSHSLEVKGSVVINGKDLEERLDTIEKVLMIPERDAILESKYPKLKKMYDEYINELSKARMWESLKGEDQ